MRVLSVLLLAVASVHSFAPTAPSWAHGARAAPAAAAAVASAARAMLRRRVDGGAPESSGEISSGRGGIIFRNQEPAAASIFIENPKLLH